VRPALFLALLLVVPARADLQPVTGANYKQAQKYSSTYLRQFVYDTIVVPNWIGKTDSFWYSYRTSKGTHYYRVNARLATREPLFDRVKLCTLLSELLQRPLDPAPLPLTRTTTNDEGTKLKLGVEKHQYEYDLSAEKLPRLGKAPPAPAPFGRGGRRGEFQRRDLDEQQLQQLREQQQQI